MSQQAELQQWFRAVDADGSGSISVQELQRALALGQLNFSLAVCAHMIRMFDRSGKGSIDLEAFARLHQFLMQMQESFRYFDTERKGSLSYSAVHQALQHAGFNLADEAFKAMFRAFDPDLDGRLGLAEYMAMTLFLRSASATFTAFDTQRTNSIHLDFNQFIYACANSR
ncbi:hypothetical protein WJX74_001723 [Apatococcus lobatus]|uniref:EF-hand domain-containing protein n=1 Tax=Apatococcus lobatus TaxID=904363 RepID=A0AAW1QII8_9CHLO